MNGERFGNYLVASEIKKKDEATQIAQLLHYIGEEGFVICNTERAETAEQNELASILKKFEDHFVPKKNFSFEQLKFFTRKQLPDESIEQFVTDLKNEASTCEFDQLKNSLVKDLFTCGIQDISLREKLLHDDDVTLDSAVQITRTFYTNEF
ncbi:hypothetical protein JTB14_023205 [Gonioctena quinquepunctata]|nr:hypothetical protein JTB14_023205 [Gonioctena quinquepunctata]